MGAGSGDFELGGPGGGGALPVAFTVHKLLVEFYEMHRLIAC